MRIVQDDIQQLMPAETDVLRTMHERGVSRVWGYRSAPDGDHERYEAATHESSMLGLQRYTDPVFRTIDECYEDSKVYDSTLTTFVTDTVTRDPATLRDYQQLVVAFLAEEGMGALLQELADHDTSDATFAFSSVVAAARSVLLLAKGCGREAYDARNDFYNAQKRARE